MPAISLSASALTTLVPENGWICPFPTASVPLLNSFLAGVNGAGRASPASDVHERCRIRIDSRGRPPESRLAAHHLRAAPRVQICHSPETKCREISGPV